MNPFAIITGAGSGVGQAVAISLLSQEWDVALVGRRKSALDETRRLAGDPAAAIVVPCDVAKAEEVEQKFAALLDGGRSVDVLVNAAGTNIAARALDVVSVADFHQLIDVNLNGTFHCVRAVLPAMRKQGRGTIVNIVSDAGLAANAKAGPAYVASKFGLTGLTQSINAEQREHGIRACAIFPGDINTPLLDKRPAPPPQTARAMMLQPQDVAACVLLAINLPNRAVIEQLVIRPQ